MASLDAREFLQSSAFENFGDIQVPDRVSPDAMWTPELARIVAAFTPKTANHVALQIDDADAVFQLGDIHHTVSANVQFRRPLKAGPHAQIVAVEIEDLDAVVFTIGRVDLALVLPDRMYGVKDARFVSRVAQVAGVARLTPRLDQRPIRSVLVDAAVAVAVGN